MIHELLDALKKEKHEREGLQQRLDLLLRRLYGPKAERFDPNQPWLIAEMAPDAEGTSADVPLSAEGSADVINADEANGAASKPKRKGHGRKPLPKDLIAQQNLLGPDADALRLQLRQEKSLFEVTALRRWLEEEQPKVLPKSLIGQAIAYALRHWAALTRFLDDGFLAIDNNIAELTLRHIAIGRKNWLFSGSAKGAQTAAVLFSVTSSCQRHKIDVFAYLHDLLERLAHDPSPAPAILRDWLPDRWKPPAQPTSAP